MRAFEDVCHHTAGDDNAMSQLTNSYHKLKPVTAAASTQTDPEEAPVAASTQTDPEQAPVHESVRATAFDEQPMYIFGLSFDGLTEQLSQT